MSNFRKFNSNSSELQSLDDIGLDEEEKASILFESTSSLNQIDLKVDWRDFSEHTVFGSAYWAVNFCLNRIYDDETGFPWDGSLSEKNEWKLSNTAFENWWFENEYPHQFGYCDIPSGSFIYFTDFEQNINAGSGSLTVEFVIKPDVDKPVNAIFSNYTGSVGVYCLLSKSTSGKTIVFARDSGSLESVSLSYDSYISSSHRISLVYDQEDQIGRIYVDGDLKSSSSFSVGEFANFNNFWQIGKLSSGSVDYFYSGSIDDFRVYQSARPSLVVKRNYGKQVHANPTASMKLYYKFNEINELSDSSIVVDYSGLSNHGTSVGSVQKISGSLGSWFRTQGDPILNQSNLRVSSSVNSWLVSGSVYDKQNQSYIFNLVPSFLIEEEENVDTQLFLLLVARHYDRIRLYAKHLAYSLHSDESDKNVAPDDFLNLLAENYGFDIGSVYEGSDAVEYFFGENILTSSFSEPLKKIRNQIRRNLVNNLIYVLKTKSTRESIDSALRALALPSDVVNINEYSILPEGISTKYYPKTSERRVMKFSSSTSVSVHSSSLGDSYNTWQVSFCLNSASISTTSSILSFYSGSERVLELRTERENPTSSFGLVRFLYEGADSGSVSSSMLNIYDGNFVTAFSFADNDAGEYRLYVGKVRNFELEFFDSSSIGDLNGSADYFSSNFTGTLGTSGSSFFDGKMMNFQAWNTCITSSSVIERRMKDFESLSTDDFRVQGNELKVFYKLNDFTSSNGTIVIHDYSGNGNDGLATNLHSTSSWEVFPGEFIEKLEPSYSYDVAINNDKIEIFSGSSKLNKSLETKDVPLVTVDISPVASLNKEIIKWFGDLEKFDQLIGKPYDKYKYELTDLNEFSSLFFQDKISTKLNFSSFINLTKWLDSNFINLFPQLIPVDLVSSISSFVVEPHIFEYNKVEHAFPMIDKIGSSKTLEVALTTIHPITGGFGSNVDLADPGRFGSPVSASADVPDAVFSFAESSSSGLSFKDLSVKKYLSKVYSENSGSEFGESSVANGFYSKTVEDENYMQNTYGVISGGLDISKTPYFGGSGFEPGYLTSAYGAPTNVFFSQSASLNFVQDQRWLYFQPSKNTTSQVPYTTKVVKGIKYGGGAGQMPFLLNRSLKSGVFFDSDTQTVLRNAGVGLEEFRNIESRPVEYSEKTEGSKTVIAWPYLDSFHGTRILSPPNDDARVGIFAENERKAGQEAEHVGEEIDIEGYKYMSFDIATDFQYFNINRNRIYVYVKFAFASDQEGLPSYETFTSSSVEEVVVTGTGETVLLTEETQIEKIYKFESFGHFTSGTFPLNYNWNISRNIPSAKKMRVYMRVEVNTPEPSVFTFLRPSCVISAKATFYKEERSDV